jgi:hypothetical protein
MGRKRGIINMGIKETMVLLGNIIIYAAITPEIAPDAPMAGTTEFL